MIATIDAPHSLTLTLISQPISSEKAGVGPAVLNIAVVIYNAALPGTGTVSFDLVTGPESLARTEPTSSVSIISKQANDVSTPSTLSSSLIFLGNSNGSRRILGLRPGSRVAILIKALVTAATVHDLSSLLWLCPLVQKNVAKINATNTINNGEMMTTSGTLNEQALITSSTQDSSLINANNTTPTLTTSSSMENVTKKEKFISHKWERTGAVFRLHRSPHLLHVQMPATTKTVS
jgi:hypothetical protein